MTQQFSGPAYSGAVRPILGRILGQMDGNRPNLITPLYGTTGALQTYTLAVSGSSNGVAYTLRFVGTGAGGAAIDFTVGFVGAASDALTAAAMEAAIDASSAGGFYTSATVTTTTTLTGRTPLNDFAITGDDAATAAILTITETQAPSTVPPAATFGRFVSLTPPADGAVLNNMTWLSTISAVTQASATLTITFDASTTYIAQFFLFDDDGDPVNTGTATGTISVAGNTNLATTVGDIVTALTAALATGTGQAVITSDGVAGTITVTVPVGWTIMVPRYEVSGGAGTIALARVAPGELPRLGLVIDNETVTPTSIGATVTAYPSGVNPVVLETGSRVTAVVTDPGAALSAPYKVFVNPATGAPTTAQVTAGNYIPLKVSEWRWQQRYASKSLATLQTQD